MNIIILSTGPSLYSTQSLLRSAEERGHNCRVIDHLKCDILMDEDGPSVFYRGEKIQNVDAIIPRIGASATYYGAAVVRQFEMMNVFSAISSLALTRSRDKLRSLQRLSKAGVGMPKTAFTNYARGDKEIIKRIGKAPVVIKLLEGTQGLGVVLAETSNAALSVIEAFEGLKARIIMQEYIKESAGSDLRALVVNGEVVGAMKRQGKEGEFRSNLHRGGEATVVTLAQEEKDIALKAVNALDLAVAGVDILQSDRGPLVLEVNASPGLEGIEGATGVDIAGKIIEYVEQSSKKKD